jgi:hypothetical protein
MIRSNEASFIKNERLKIILIQIYVYNSDVELSRATLDIFHILSRHIQLKHLQLAVTLKQFLLNKDEFLFRTFELLNSESSEEIELSVEIMRNLIAI